MIRFNSRTIAERPEILYKKKSVSINILKPFTGWVLDGLIRDAASSMSQDLSWNIFPRRRVDWFSTKVIASNFFPRACNIAFFAHHETYLKYGARSIFNESEKRLYLTHLNESADFTKDEIATLNTADFIFTQNSNFRNKLISMGMTSSKFLLTPGGVDRMAYFPRKNMTTNSYILISGYFKYRKNPELIADVIRKMPDINFLLHGRFKEEFPLGFFDNTQNVNWIEFDKLNQPALMQNAEVFLSLSRIEGGPIGILEALACGVPVVATNTGFASEFLNPNNGVLLSNPPLADEVISAVRQVLAKFQGLPRGDFLEGKQSLQDLGRIFFDEH